MWPDMYLRATLQFPSGYERPGLSPRAMESSGLEVLPRVCVDVHGACYHQRLCECLGYKTPPEAVLGPKCYPVARVMSISVTYDATQGHHGCILAQATSKDHVWVPGPTAARVYDDIHDLCHHQGPHRYLGPRLQLGLEGHHGPEFLSRISKST